VSWFDDWDEWMRDLFFSNLGFYVGQNMHQIKVNEKFGKLTDKVAQGNQTYANKAGVSPTASPSPAPSPKPSPTSTPIPKGQTPEQMAAGYGLGAQDEYAKRMGGSRSTGKYDLTEDSPVYLGRYKVADPRHAALAAGAKGEKTAPLGEVINQIYGWDDKKTRAFSELASQAGYKVSSTINKNELIPVWTDMVKLAAGTYRAGKKLDPWTLMRRYAAGGELEGGSQTKTTTNTNVSVTNALTAEQLAHAALSQRLGRAATDMEVEEFKKALASAEKKNPTVTTTTTTTNASGNETSSSTQREGINNQDFAIQWAGEHNTAEAKAYQAAGIMMPWLMEALSAPV